MTALRDEQIRKPLKGFKQQSINSWIKRNYILMQCKASN